MFLIKIIYSFTRLMAGSLIIIKVLYLSKTFKLKTGLQRLVCLSLVKKIKICQWILI